MDLEGFSNLSEFVIDFYWIHCLWGSAQVMRWSLDPHPSCHGLRFPGLSHSAELLGAAESGCEMILVPSLLQCNTGRLWRMWGVILDWEQSVSWLLVIKESREISFRAELGNPSLSLPAKFLSRTLLGSVYLNSPAACGLATHFTQYKILSCCFCFFFFRSNVFICLQFLMPFS